MEHPNFMNHNLQKQSAPEEISKNEINRFQVS